MKGFGRIDWPAARKGSGPREQVSGWKSISICNNNGDTVTLQQAGHTSSHSCVSDLGDG